MNTVLGSVFLLLGLISTSLGLLALSVHAREPLEDFGGLVLVSALGALAAFWASFHFFGL